MATGENSALEPDIKRRPQAAEFLGKLATYGGRLLSAFGNLHRMIENDPLLFSKNVTEKHVKSI